MRRAVGIASVAALALVAGLAGLGQRPIGGGVLSPRKAHARPANERWLEAASVVVERSRGDGFPAGGTRVTVRNDMPVTITIVTQPEGRTYRVGWGGGDIRLGTDPVAALAIFYHDPYWPYVYAVTCPSDDAEVCLRMSDVWHGRMPQGFTVRRGRPVSDGIVWFDVGEKARG